jgi:uncharacterized protein (TIGR03905 family)
MLLSGNLSILTKDLFMSGLSIENNPRTDKPREKVRYATHGVCCQFVGFSVDREGRVWDISLEGGCPGHSIAFSKLAEGRSIKVLIKTLKGIPCRHITNAKDSPKTSCADQFAKMLERYLANHQVNDTK